MLGVLRYTRAPHWNLNIKIKLAASLLAKEAVAKLTGVRSFDERGPRQLSERQKRKKKRAKVRWSFGVTSWWGESSDDQVSRSYNNGYRRPFEEAESTWPNSIPKLDSNPVCEEEERRRMFDVRIRQMSHLRMKLFQESSSRTLASRTKNRAIRILCKLSKIIRSNFLVESVIMSLD